MGLGSRGSWILQWSTAFGSYCDSCNGILILLTVTWCLCRPECVAGSGRGLPLNEYISNFEPLYYDHEYLRHQHERVKRSTDGEMKLEFTALSRLFRLQLHRDLSIFSDDVVFEINNDQIFYDTSKVYIGQLEDDELSVVQGTVGSEGFFEGTVSARNEDYFIEPASLYFREPRDFHSVIYKSSDVHFPFTNYCLSGELYGKWRTKHLFHHDHLHVSDFNGNNFVHVYKFTSNLRNESRAWHKEKVAKKRRKKILLRQKYLEQETNAKSFNDSSYNELYWETKNFYGKHRKTKKATTKLKKPKRSALAKEQNSSDSAKQRGHSILPRAVDPKKTSCTLYVQGDHLFYQRFKSEEACIDQMTRHIQRVNAIFKGTDFDQDGIPDNIGFIIKRVKVYTLQALQDPKYRFPGNYGVEKFLELFSEDNYNAFCLAYMFTNRDFEGGTLGLAWTGDLKNAGGVCERNGLYRGSQKSLNTGIVTLMNYGKAVPPTVSHVTLAHEIGHNFGSPHDPEDNVMCTPGGGDGNYIMFARATSGDKKNNVKFSPCSLNSISLILGSRARNSEGCFTEPQHSICGNEVVEPGEECDCGWTEDCQEICCNPMRGDPPPGQLPCTRKPNMSCSPSEGPCCTADCILDIGTRCRDDNGCRDIAYCAGASPACPVSQDKPNKTICNKEFVCFNGECTGSICMAYGLESCQCHHSPGDLDTKPCELCCKKPGDNEICRSSFEWNDEEDDIPNLMVKPGSPCNDYNGYCDVFHKCREIDPSGPLATLRKLLLSNESIATFGRWLLDYWWAALLISMSFIVSMILFVRICGKRPPKVKQEPNTRHWGGRTNPAFGGSNQTNPSAPTNHLIIGHRPPEDSALLTNHVIVNRIAEEATILTNHMLMGNGHAGGSSPIVNHLPVCNGHVPRSSENIPNHLIIKNKMAKDKNGLILSNNIFTHANDTGWV